ncbi:phage terminase, large subunit [Lactiplantibacillus plantarum subsp. plantarum]|nr:phage terminase, large subunit [Lactiplantibacillus plantarum subsp. plantarum]
MHEARPLFVIKEAIDAFLDEIYQYVWDEATGLPVKLNDDVMDALRYAVYNTHERLKARTIKKPKGLRG